MFRSKGRRAAGCANPAGPGQPQYHVASGPKHVRTAYERFFAALEVLGKSQVQFQVLNTSFSFDGALETAGKLFELYPDTDGVIAVNDIVAPCCGRRCDGAGRSRRRCKSSVLTNPDEQISVSRFIHHSTARL